MSMEKTYGSVSACVCIFVSLTFYEFVEIIYLDCRLYEYCSSSMLYYREKNSGTEYVEQLRKIKFILIHKRYRIVHSVMYYFISNIYIIANYKILIS
jgi:predicted methyltransferase